MTSPASLGSDLDQIAPMKRVLVVEDDGDVRRSLADALRQAGYRPLTAGNGVEALALLSNVDVPDLILLDLMMPRMDGWEFLEELREDPELSDIPVIVLSARAKQPIRFADAFLAKPFELDDLLRTIHQYCP